MPIVQHILANSNTDDSRLYGLILTPTRELAMQVKDHIVNIAKFSKIKVKKGVVCWFYVLGFNTNRWDHPRSLLLWVVCRSISNNVY